MMPEEAPPPGTACVVLDCQQSATLYVQVVDSTVVEQDNSSIAMCDSHATNWREGDLG